MIPSAAAPTAIGEGGGLLHCIAARQAPVGKGVQADAARVETCPPDATMLLLSLFQLLKGFNMLVEEKKPPHPVVSPPPTTVC